MKSFVVVFKDSEELTSRSTFATREEALGAANLKCPHRGSATVYELPIGEKLAPSAEYCRKIAEVTR